MKNKIKVTEGQKYGKLTIIKEVSPIGSKRRILCKCDCGNIKEYSMDRVIHGRTRSCGCLRNEMFLAHRNNNGTSKYPKEARESRLLGIWYNMKERCYTKSSSVYRKYGEKGITICDEWRNDFMTFYNWAISNGYSEELTIDRIDSNGNYEPSNCRWVNNEAQANNRKSNVLITYNGETHTITEWSKILNIKKEVLFSRKYNGWSIERMFSTPIKKK